MSSLSTVYAITTVLSSIAGMGAAFIGNRIFPLAGGSRPPPPTPAEVEQATRIAADKAQKLAAAEDFEKELPELVQTPPETPPELVQTPPETPPELIKTPPETPPELVQTPPETPESVPEVVQQPPENPEDSLPIKLPPENPEDLLPPENPEDIPEPFPDLQQSSEDIPTVQAAKGRKKRHHK
jgi:hypothetical protein